MNQENEAAEELDIDLVRKVYQLVESGELEDFLQRIKTAMPEEEYKTIEAVVDWHVQFFDVLKDEDVTVDELQERFLPSQG